MNKRVTTVSKNQLLSANMEEKGLAFQMVDLLKNTRVKSTDEDSHKKLLSAVKRKVKKGIESWSSDELVQYLNEVSFGTMKIKDIRFLDPENFDDHPSIQLAGACTRKLNSLSASHTKEVAREIMPMEICWVNQLGQEKKGITLLNESINAKMHKTSRYLKRVHYKSQIVFDLASLISEVLVGNGLERFARENENLIQYLLVKELINRKAPYSRTNNNSSNVLYIPEDEEFAEDVLFYIEKYQLGEGKEIEKGSWLDAYKDHFYLKDSDDLPYFLTKGPLQRIVSREFVGQYEYVKEKTKRQLDARADYARSFETKKHINKKQAEAMKDNAFLKRYGYVEIDNEVLFRSDLESKDLTKEEKEHVHTFEDLEEEFNRLLENFYIPESQGSFRIKRLGNLKAAGVYYPHVNATIIDREHPDSFVHELGHQIDFSMAESSFSTISEALTFRPIIEMYEMKAQKSIDDLPSDDPFKKQWNGNTKFNKNYYLQPTEIFARSFELYLYHKGIRSSFLKKVYRGPQYPHDDEYIKRIHEYFDRLFTLVTPPNMVKRNESVAASPSTSINQENYEEMDFVDDGSGQLTLF